MRFIFPYESKSSGSFGTILTATLWVNVLSPDGSISFYFLFDTGADVTSLPVSSAEKLGINIDRSPKEPMSGFEGTTIFVYRSEIILLLNTKKIKVPCVFNPHEDVPLLLGRAGILDRFSITLDAKKKEMVFEEM